MAEKIDIETLSAYVDGELGDRRAEAIEAQMANDAATRSLVRDLQRCDVSLRAAFTSSAREDPPQTLVHAIDTAFSARRWRSRQSLRRAALPIAASIIGILATSVAGYVIFASRLDNAVEKALQAREREQSVIADTLNTALETMISGKTVSWEVSETGSRGAVTPTRTYRSKSGHWCREYRIRTDAGPAKRAWRGLACRTGRSGWMTLQEFYYEPRRAGGRSPHERAQ